MTLESPDGEKGVESKKMLEEEASLSRLPQTPAGGIIISETQIRSNVHVTTNLLEQKVEIAVGFFDRRLWQHTLKVGER